MKLRRLLFAAAVFLIALEVVLQVGALAVHWLRPRPALAASAALPASAARVLCIGDSFTFGLGATSRAMSYPSQLEELLRARGIDAAVANAGFPGQHSGDLLSRLADQRSPTTEVLCVLVGANDSWRRPERFVASGEQAAPEGFRLTWRTGVLAKMLWNFDLNAWQRTESATPPAATTAPDTIARGFELWQSIGVLPATARPVRYPAAVGGMPPDKGPEVWSLIGRGDLTAACRVATDLTHSFPDAPDAWSLLVSACTKAGFAAEAESALDSLRRLHAAAPTDASTEQLASALLQCGHVLQAIELAGQRVKAEPAAVEAWLTLQRGLNTLGRNEEAKPAMREALALLGRTWPKESARIACSLARLLSDQTELMASLLVGAWCLDHELPELRLALGMLKSKLPRHQFEAVLARTGIAGEAAVVRLLDEVYAGAQDAPWRQVLRAHLEEMGQLAQRRGIRMVVLGYPFRQRQVEDEQKAAARALAVPFVAIGERFDAELAKRTRDQLFVSDGHCNDAGYGIMAAMVADVVAPMLGK